MFQKVTIKARWEKNRPFIQNGPLSCDYVFSQIHFHWSQSNLEGSEHTFDGVRYHFRDIAHYSNFSGTQLSEDNFFMTNSFVFSTSKKLLVCRLSFKPRQSVPFQDMSSNISVRENLFKFSCHTYSVQRNICIMGNCLA